jgi:oxygen-dependent protoporphyrinogen oxidase
METVRDRLARPPVVGVGVRRIERSPNAGSARPSWVVRSEGQDQWSADAVLLACPAPQQAAIVADIDPELAEKIGGIAYNRIAVVALGYRAADVPTALDGFGYIAPQRTRRDLLGVQWCSSIFPDRAPPGMVLLRALCGGWHRAEVTDWDDARLAEAVRAELRLALGITAAPHFQQIVRWEKAIPQYLLGHLDRVAWIEQRVGRHPGLFLTGNAYHGVAFNDCTEQAGLVAERVAEFLR